MQEIDQSRLSQFISDKYGIGGKLFPLAGEVDINFRLGKDYLVKMSAESDLGFLEMQNEVFSLLRRQDLSFSTPEVVTDLEGNLINIYDLAGKDYHLRILKWIDGLPLGRFKPHHPSLLRDIGQCCGWLSHCLKDYDHPAAHRSFDWDVTKVNWVSQQFDLFNDEDRITVEDAYNRVHGKLSEMSGDLRMGVCYHDANDFNLIVNPDSGRISGIIDFGDVLFAPVVSEVAIAMAYCAMNKKNPLEAAAHVLAGYYKVFRLEAHELDIIYEYVMGRLLISLTHAARRRRTDPKNKYLQISAVPAMDLLGKWLKLDRKLVHFTFRAACGLDPVPQSSRIIDKIKSEKNIKPVIRSEILHGEKIELDLSIGSAFLGHYLDYEDEKNFLLNFQRIVPKNVLGIGKYLEARPFYTDPVFCKDGNNGAIRRSRHLGIDLFYDENTEVFSPLPGVVHSIYNNLGARNYGPTVILKHQISDFQFFTLYGHLSYSMFDLLHVDQQIPAGALIGHFGSPEVNGGWPPHLHFQIILDLLDCDYDFPGVAAQEELSLWSALSPDPSLLVPLVKLDHIVDTEEVTQNLLTLRQHILGKNLSISYEKPLHVVRGKGAYLIDSDGRYFLDMVNNVAHVGHEHPLVVNAIKKQSAVLNTNTRYLHKNILDFADAIVSRMPEYLEVVYVCNSGSEANELAMRMARSKTGSDHVLAIEHAYHGNTQGCIDVSPYKFLGPGGSGPSERVTILPAPDPYRGIYSDVPLSEQSSHYIADVEQIINKLIEQSSKAPAIIAEPILSCGGQIVPPPHYLKRLFGVVRDHGGVSIADEVQTGCGRVGSHFWAFEEQRARPDIVTIGKPIGNGHPLGVVVCTREIAESFNNGMEYFNTFGGNPVSCAVGLEVLNTIQEEKLMENALFTGGLLLEGIKNLAMEYRFIGAVRGRGLFLGFELVKNWHEKEPSMKKADYIVHRMCQLGILLSTDGPHHNVIKIKPPLVFSEDHAKDFLEKLEIILAEIAIRTS